MGTSKGEQRRGYSFVVVFKESGHCSFHKLMVAADWEFNELLIIKTRVCKSFRVRGDLGFL